MTARLRTIALFSCLFLALPLLAQTNLLPNGDMEELRPNFWAPFGDNQAGVQCEWAWEGYDSQHSFKVSKTATTAQPAGWVSENNAKLYWNNAKADRLYSLSFWAKTVGVNTNPATDDGKIGVLFSFYAGGTLLGEQFVTVDQSVANKEWTEYTDGLLIPAGTDPDEMYMKLVMGKDATGTVYFDNIGCGSDPWSMWPFNGDAETPEGWMEWHAGTEGFANLDNTEKHSGTWSALLRETDDNGDEMVFYSEPIPVEPNTWYKISVWVKRDQGLTNPEWLPSNVTGYRHDSRMNVCFFYHRDPIYTDWNLTGGDQFFYFDERDSSSDWTYYTIISKSQPDAAGLSVRARFNPFTKGFCWYDDFTIEKLELGPNLLPNGDMEELRPNFWAPFGDNQAGVQCEWAWEGYDSQHSFKVSKTATTAQPAGWVSENNAKLYWNNAKADRLYSLSFWAKTVGVNTNPATDDGKIGVLFSFYAGGTLLGEQFVTVDQSVANKEWTEYTDGLLIPAGTDPDEMYMKLVMGKDATGTVYFDNIGCGSDPWSMWPFNGDAETPEGWMEWHAGTEGFANLDNTEKHSGTWSALLRETDDNGDEMVFYSEPIPVEPNTWYKISVWVKRDQGLTNPEWLPSNVTGYRHDSRMNVCFFYHRDPIYTDWNLTGGDQFFYFDERDSSSDWTYYTIISKSQPDAAGLSVRARFNPFTKGFCWYDDFTVQKVTLLPTAVEQFQPLAGHQLPKQHELLQNYPNPFNPSTTIEYTVPRDGQVTLEVYNVLGQKVATLVDGFRLAGRYTVVWDGTDTFGKQVPSGMYVYKLNGSITRKMMLVK
ncbi:MAG: T9SS type A sorting domain-containing protein [bacterium]|nr:T9SS type A sorting domain-containing protein [bacterium]